MGYTYLSNTKKDQTVRFILDFCELNKQIKRKPCPIPKIQDLLLKVEGFQYATALDLNMGYYHIGLDPESSRLCTIVLYHGETTNTISYPWVYETVRTFPKRKWTSYLQGSTMYEHTLLVVIKGSCEDHLKNLNKVLENTETTGLKINTTKSYFAAQELEYLG